jgi:Saxitoxin biosynthesis operon protein SxtJ
MAGAGHHEQFQELTGAEIGSDRSFCFVFTGVFLVVGLWPLLRGGPFRTWALIAAAIFLLIGLVAPKAVHGLNVAWMKLALLIAKVTNPIVTALLFFLVFTPFALFFRVIGRDALRLRKDAAAASYWIPREPPGPDPATMPNQY